MNTKKLMEFIDKVVDEDEKEYFDINLSNDFIIKYKKIISNKKIKFQNYLINKIYWYVTYFSSVTEEKDEISKKFNEDIEKFIDKIFNKKDLELFIKNDKIGLENLIIDTIEKIVIYEKYIKEKYFNVDFIMGFINETGLLDLEEILLVETEEDKNTLLDYPEFLIEKDKEFTYGALYLFDNIHEEYFDKLNTNKEVMEEFEKTNRIAINIMLSKIKNIKKEYDEKDFFMQVMKLIKVIFENDNKMSIDTQNTALYALSYLYYNEEIENYKFSDLKKNFTLLQDINFYEEKNKKEKKLYVNNMVDCITGKVKIKSDKDLKLNIILKKVVIFIIHLFILYIIMKRISS